MTDLLSLSRGRRMRILDLHPEKDILKEEVLEGLCAAPKHLPCKLLYDERGSKLFDRICELEEYYLTRTEMSIMEAYADEMVDRLGTGVLLVEYGSGSSVKTRSLLDRLSVPVGYVPIDISKQHLVDAAKSIAVAYPEIEVIPVCADYTQQIRLPQPSVKASRVVVFFPGSTIGNFDPDEARSFLRRIAATCSRGGGLLIGVDLQKPTSVIESAYNDEAGVTADFNKNILRRINREIGSDFELDRFDHDAVYNSERGRIEMYLVSRIDQTVRVDGLSVELGRGERICTEHSYKYTHEGFAGLAASAGFDVREVWTDPRSYFSVQYLVAA
ncbi:MAG: L-histidine N(alpha)-methyltransferase [Rhodothermales bacterium]